jgi:purine-binding chemotaxis protein CheW
MKCANCASYWKGVVNLRGVIVPIVDLRIKLELGQPAYDESTVVIVLDLDGRQIGVVVDSVSDVVSIPAQQIKTPPPSGPNFRHDYLTGIATIDERLLQLVNLNLLLAETASTAALPHAA